MIKRTDTELCQAEAFIGFPLLEHLDRHLEKFFGIIKSFNRLPASRCDEPASIIRFFQPSGSDKRDGTNPDDDLIARRVGSERIIPGFKIGQGDRGLDVPDDLRGIEALWFKP